jgi:LuxR family transcriptional regulator, quorum-sensing system regulator SolR
VDINNPADNGPPPLRASSPEACFEHIAELARELGFEFAVHGMRMPLPITRPLTTFHSNYPPAWLQRYQEQRYIEIDPTVAHGMRSSKPVVWTDAFFAQAPALWAEARSFGIHHGWAQSRRDAEGTYSMLVLARGAGAITTDELRDKQERMQWLVYAAHVSMQASCNEGPAAPPAKVELSAREVDVLRWTAEGKTAAEIAAIIDVSERTVNFHINNAVAKLGACNKTSAAVRAAMLGLIW